MRLILQEPGKMLAVPRSGSREQTVPVSGTRRLRSEQILRLPGLCAHVPGTQESTCLVSLFVLELSHKRVPQRNEEELTLVSDKLSCSSRGRASFSTLKILIQKNPTPHLCYNPHRLQLHNLEHLSALLLLKGHTEPTEFFILLFRCLVAGCQFQMCSHPTTAGAQRSAQQSRKGTARFPRPR